MGRNQSNSATDSEIMNYLGMPTSENAQNKIPEWFKINFPKWVLDDRVNEEDMKEALTWRDKKNII